MKKQENLNKPECYTPNNDPYPLCNGINIEKCKWCCLYENYAGDEPPME
jgi:hypothetical protein